MSSILNALKKLESQKVPQNGRFETIDSEVAAEAGKGEGLRPKAWVVCIGGIAFILLGAMGFLAIERLRGSSDTATEFKPVPVETASSGNAPATGPAPPDAETAPDRSKASVSRTPAPPSPRETSRDGGHAKPAASPKLTASDKVSPKKVAAPPEPIPDKSIPTTSGAIVRSTESSPTIEAVPDELATDAGTSEADNGFDDLPLLPKAEISLQAISWSDAPERRIAVVDGEIVKEGRQVAGYTVERIRPDDVILAKDGLRFRMAFKTN